MSEKTVKLHSSVAIEIFGPNKIKDFKSPDVKLNKEGKVQSVEAKWTKKRVQIKKGQNIVPEECLEWSMIKTLRDKGKITVDTSGTKKEKPTPKE